MLLCLHSTIHCKFYTLTNQSLLLWHKYLESLGKNNVFTHVFLQYVMEDEHAKGPSHNNPEEAANYVKAVNLCYNPLSVTSVVSTIINVYLHGRLFCTLYPSSSPNWTAHISPTWTHKLYLTQYQTNPVPLFLHVLKKQQSAATCFQ